MDIRQYNESGMLICHAAMHPYVLLRLTWSTMRHSFAQLKYQAPPPFFSQYISKLMLLVQLEKVWVSIEVQTPLSQFVAVSDEPDVNAVESTSHVDN